MTFAQRLHSTLPFGSLASLLLAVLVMAGATTEAASQSQQEYEAQIRTLMNHPAVRSALEHIEETDDQTMADLMALTQIPVPPFMEEERGLASA